MMQARAKGAVGGAPVTGVGGGGGAVRGGGIKPWQGIQRARVGLEAGPWVGSDKLKKDNYQVAGQQPSSRNET